MNGGGELAASTDAGVTGATPGAMATIWERFQDQFRSQVSVLEEAAAAVLSDGLPSDLRERARREAHKLTGSLGTLGLLEASERAREIEAWFTARAGAANSAGAVAGSEAEGDAGTTAGGPAAGSAAAGSAAAGSAAAGSAEAAGGGGAAGSAAAGSAEAAGGGGAAGSAAAGSAEAAGGGGAAGSAAAGSAEAAGGAAAAGLAEAAGSSAAAAGGASAVRLSDAVVALRDHLEAGPSPESARMSAPADHARPFLLLVDDDATLAAGLRREAPVRGLGLEAVAGVEEARQVLAGRRPEAVLMTMAGPGTDDALAFMGELSVAEPPIPLMVLTRKGTFTDRVEAARRGVCGFLQAPITPADALLAVHDMIQQVRTSKAGVLAVDDDPAVIAALDALLQPQGHRVIGLSESDRLLETLEAETPDAVVLDVEMAPVDGIELCRVIRADQRWAQLPILFLTAQSDAVTVQKIFAAGADDFVAKPIVGPELTTRILNRLERSRLLRRMAETDGLTGVANRPKSLAAAQRMLSRGERSGQPVAVATLDVDRLRVVNARFGYGAGDEVLARLGHLLLRSFRADDVVGRWGGQEFFVAMLGMTRGDGVCRLADLLEELRRERFSNGIGGTFAASFSAGVAQYPDDGVDVRLLFWAADGALRRSKNVGGDRVFPVGWSDADASLTDVVLVEDDDALAAILLHGLATRGYRTKRFDDGHDATHALQGPSPKVCARVVLLDWGLPSMDGLRVLRRLAETGVLARTRVIMLTARDSESEVLQALDLGAFDHVAKPFSTPVLMKRVHRAMEW